MSIWVLIFWLAIVGLFAAGLGYYAGVVDEQRHQDRIRQAAEAQSARVFPWRLNNEQQ